MEDFIVSRAGDGRVWVALDNEVGDKGSFIRGTDGAWTFAYPPSADDLKDNWSPVEGDEAKASSSV